MSNSNDGVSWRRDHQNPSEFTGYERRKEWNYNEIWQTNADSHGPPGTYNYGQGLKDLYSESQPQYPENSGSYSRYDDQANSTVKPSYNRRSPDTYRRSPDAYRRHDRSRSNSRFDSRNRRSRRSSRERHRSSRHRRTHSRSKSRSKSRSTDRRKDSDKHRHKRRHSRSKSRDRRRRSTSNTRSTSSRNNKSNSRRSKKRISSSDSDNETTQTQNIEILVPKVTIESAFKNDGSFLEMFKKLQDEENAKKEEAEKEIEKAPIPIIGKRRGGRVLKTGIVEKLKLAEDDANDGKPKDAWTIYMQEVKKYREASCQDEGKTRPLVK